MSKAWRLSSFSSLDPSLGMAEGVQGSTGRAGEHRACRSCCIELLKAGHKLTKFAEEEVSLESAFMALTKGVGAKI